MEPNSVKAVECSGLAKDYAGNLRDTEKCAVSGLDLSVAAGSIHGFLGHNGAGKSTTIKMMLGLIKPSAGSVKLFGCPVAEAPFPEGVFYLPESVSFHEFLTPLEVLEFYSKLNPLSFAGSNPVEIRDRSIAALDEAGLAKWSGTPVEKFSKGMRQRLAIAACILKKPRLMILDEPATGLDPEGIKLLLDVILRARSQGATVFFSSHHISEIDRVCDAVSIMRYGKLVETSNVAELKAGGIDIEERYLSLMREGGGVEPK